jgi:hypothetical protein
MHKFLKSFRISVIIKPGSPAQRRPESARAGGETGACAVMGRSGAGTIMQYVQETVLNHNGLISAEQTARTDGDIKFSRSTLNSSINEIIDLSMGIPKISTNLGRHIHC